MCIIITGSNGFLGRYLMSHLNLPNLIPYNRSNSNSTRWDKVHGIIHCAGLAHNSHDPKLELLYREANVELTKSLIDSFQKSKAEFFIFISTTTIYGNQSLTSAPLNETIVGSKLSIYAHSKLQAEEEVLQIKEKKIFVLRPAVIVGPEPKGNLKLLELVISKSIPIVIPRISSNNNLTDIRNMNHVIKYMIANYRDVESGIYNIVDNKRPSFKELLEKIANSKNKKAYFISVPNYIFEILLKLLGFVSKNYKEKILRLLYNSTLVSNKKINKITTLPYNSYE